MTRQMLAGHLTLEFDLSRHQPSSPISERSGT
jgi:hypothetical protein